jgi:hypothetical protein
MGAKKANANMLSPYLINCFDYSCEKLLLLPNINYNLGNGMSRDGRNQIVSANVKVKKKYPYSVPYLFLCPGQNMHKIPTRWRKDGNTEMAKLFS